MELPRELSEFDKDLLAHIKRLSFALSAMLTKTGALDCNESTTGDMMITAAKEYCKK